MNRLSKICMFLLLAVTGVLFTVGMWKINHELHIYYGYEAKMEIIARDTVRDMVNLDCLSENAK